MSPILPTAPGFPSASLLGWWFPTSQQHNVLVFYAVAMMTSLMMTHPRLTLAEGPMTSGTVVSEDPRATLTVSLHDLLRNWTQVEQSLTPCPSEETVKLRLCPTTTTVTTGNASLNNMATCPWEVLTDAHPFRIPREIRYARCICKYAQEIYSIGNFISCQENYVNVPYVLCDQDPMLRGQSAGQPSPTCLLGMKRVPVSCGAAVMKHT